MPMMVHLTSAKNIRQILRTGIRKSGHGIFCMPVLQDYYSSHQWLRELRRWKSGPYVAVYFRLDDDEIVGCGPYWEAHRFVSAGNAVRLFRQQPDTQGWEILVQRSITSRELHKIKVLSQVLGWRYGPYFHDKPWCNCSICVSRGEFNSSKKRRHKVSLKYDEIIASLYTLSAQYSQENDSEIIDLLSQLQYRKAGRASDFLFLLDHPSNDVLESFAALLGVYKGRDAKRLLQAVNNRRGVGDREAIQAP